MLPKNDRPRHAPSDAEQYGVGHEAIQSTEHRHSRRNPVQRRRAGRADADQCRGDKIDGRPEHDRGALARRRLWIPRRLWLSRWPGLSGRGVSRLRLSGLWLSRLGYGVAAGAIVGGAIARRSYYGYSGGYGYSSGYPAYGYASVPRYGYGGYGGYGYGYGYPAYSYAAVPQYGYGGGYGYGYGSAYCPPYGGYAAASYYGW